MGGLKGFQIVHVTDYITCEEEEEEEGNGTFYPDHYNSSGSDMGIKKPHSICTPKLS